MMCCTFRANSSGNGGAIHGYAIAPAITDSILWGDGPDEIRFWYGYPDATYTDVASGFPGPGNIMADPLFVSGPLGNEYLSHIAAGQQYDSPCIDGG